MFPCLSCVLVMSELSMPLVVDALVSSLAASCIGGSKMPVCMVRCAGLPEPPKGLHEVERPRFHSRSKCTLVMQRPSAARRPCSLLPTSLPENLWPDTLSQACPEEGSLSGIAGCRLVSKVTRVWLSGTRLALVPQCASACFLVD
jgi:hypothetical protein